MKLNKIVATVLTGIALLVLPAANGYAQECRTHDDMRAAAAEQKVVEVTHLIRPGVQTFLSVFLTMTQGSVTPEELEALTPINAIGIFETDETSFIVVYVADCAINVVPVPKALMDEVLKQVEQRAINGENRA